MRQCTQENYECFREKLPDIEAYMSQWQIVSLRFPETHKQEIDITLDALSTHYSHKDGLIYKVLDYKIIMAARLGHIKNYAHLKAEIEQALPEHIAQVSVRAMNICGLDQIRAYFSEDADKQEQGAFFKEREKREKNIIMIAEDDEFVINAIKGVLQSYGEIIELADGTELVEKYESLNPDILFLDIHLPNNNGLTLIHNLMALDDDAFIIFVSADSQKDNIFDALESGAEGFLAKPVQKEKLIEHLGRSITFNIQ